MSSSKLSQFFQLPESTIAERCSWSKSIIYILVAYLFGLAVRMLMWLQAMQIEPFWDGSSPVSIWQPDAGRYGFYAKSILSGADLPYSNDYLLGHLIAGVVDLTGFSIDWVMLLLPLSIAPLIVIPIMMIANRLKIPTFGFLVALISVSGKFYYSRSYVGYMDTDWINLLLVLTSMASIILAIKRSELLYGLFGGITMILFGVWYHSASSILLAIVGSTLAYILFFDRKNIITLQIFMTITLSILPLPAEYKIGALLLLVMLFFFINKSNLLPYRFYLISIGILSLLALLLIDPDHYLARAMGYLNPSDAIHFTAGGIEYLYPNDLLTVSEAKGSHIWNSSGPTPLYTAYIFVGTLGYLLMVVRYRVMLITAPLILLGFASSFAGTRFDMYATVAMAFGVVYILYLLRYMLMQRFKSPYAEKSAYYATVILLVMMIWNIFYINKAYLMTLIFYGNDKHALEKFGREVDRSDTIINSWDYGWPLWYYTAHDNTIADNGYHGGPDMNLIYKIFMSSDENFTAKASLLLANGRIEARDLGEKFVLPVLLRDQNYTELLSSINSSSIGELYKGGDVYIFLHKGMMEFYYTMLSTASVNLHGDITDRHEHYKVTSLVKPFSKTYSLVEGFSFILDSSEGMVTDEKGDKTPLNSIMITDNHRKKYKYIFHKDAKNYMFTYEHNLYWIDEKYYKSFYVQAMMFDNYDRDLFEKVAETNRLKILKIKR